MKNKIHLVAAIVAILCIATFLTSTILVEVLGSKESVAKVKNLIVMPGLFLLIPSMAAVGMSGFAIAKKRNGRLIRDKQKRMPVIALNGLLILVPCAIFLNHCASVGLFDARFYAVQAIELIAGAVNLTLMSRNMRDGLRLAGRIKRNSSKG